MQFKVTLENTIGKRTPKPEPVPDPNPKHSMAAENTRSDLYDNNEYMTSRNERDQVTQIAHDEINEFTKRCLN
jgi:hypothetical protein